VRRQIADLIPRQLFHDRYRVVRSIRVGSMGGLYEVVDERTGMPRALKVISPSLLPPDPEHRARFVIEARIAGSLVSEHIVRTLEVGVDDALSAPFLVTELFRGEFFSTILERGPLPLVEAVLYLSQIALALDKAHAQGLVHRDLQPENLFLTPREDGTPCVKLLDFGLAKLWQSDTTLTRGAVGTPLYVAPEQLTAPETAGAGVDIYGLGLVAYAFLTGEAYWREEQERHAGSTYRLAMATLNHPLEPPTARAYRRKRVELPPAFDPWFATCTALRPESRYVRITEAMLALSSALGFSTRSATGTLERTERAPTPSDVMGTIPPASRPKRMPTRATPSIPLGVPSERSPVGPTSTRNITRLSQAGYTISVDPSRKLVHVRVWGFWTNDIGQQYLEEFRQKSLPFWGDRWFVLADIREFPAQRPEVGEHVKGTMVLAQQNGIVRAANLVASALSKMHIARLSAEQRLPEYSFFTDEQEAIRWLLGS
jgi:serine/threonine-protein kinase